VSGRRGALDRLSIGLAFALPVIVNGALGAILIHQIATQPSSPSVLGRGNGPPPIASAGSPIPGVDIGTAVAQVAAATGHPYDCAGPYGGASGIRWACRSQDAVVVLSGNPDGSIVALDATWFGFLDGGTDLPAWAAAMAPADAQAVTSWVSRLTGTSSSVDIGGLHLSLGGARGARELSVTGP
jgi:hypothetical protein